MQCILFHSFPFFWFLSLFVITRAPALSYVWGIEWKKNKRILYIKIDLSVVKVNGWTEWGNHITLLNGDNFLNFYCIRTQIKWHWMQWHWLQTYGLAIIGQTYKHPRFVDCHIMWRLQNVWCIFEQSRKCFAFFFFVFNSRKDFATKSNVIFTVWLKYKSKQLIYRNEIRRWFRWDLTWLDFDGDILLCCEWRFLKIERHFKLGWTPPIYYYLLYCSTCFESVFFCLSFIVYKNKCARAYSLCEYDR